VSAETSARPRVLVVDDDEQVRGVLRRLLERHGYDCLEARDSAGARSLVTGTDSIDVMLCDVHLPGESGLDLIRDVLAVRPDLAAVLTTGLDDPALARAALDLGLYGYVSKPFRFNDLLVILANALRRRALEIDAREHRGPLQNTRAEPGM
jgi:DNA-binding NtrC family response regulator